MIGEFLVLLKQDPYWGFTSQEKWTNYKFKKLLPFQYWSLSLNPDLMIMGIKVTLERTSTLSVLKILIPVSWEQKMSLIFVPRLPSTTSESLPSIHGQKSLWGSCGILHPMTAWEESQPPVCRGRLSSGPCSGSWRGSKPSATLWEPLEITILGSHPCGTPKFLGENFQHTIEVKKSTSGGTGVDKRNSLTLPASPFLQHYTA